MTGATLTCRCAAALSQKEREGWRSAPVWIPAYAGMTVGDGKG